MSQDSFFEYRDQTGIIRKVGQKPMEEKHRKVMAARTNIADYRANIPGEPAVFTMKQIWDKVAAAGGKIDFTPGKELRKDQGTLGACNAAAAAASFETFMWMSGRPVPRLSWQYLYDAINGHQDGGSVPTEAMMWLENHGVPAESFYSSCTFRDPRVPAGTPMYREDVAMTVNTAEQIATAILMRHPTQFGIIVNRRFEVYTPGGISYNGGGPDASGYANHSVHGTGLEIIENKLTVISPNTWGYGWGFFRDGTFRVLLESLNYVSQDSCGVVHLSSNGAQ